MCDYILESPVLHIDCLETDLSPLELEVDALENKVQALYTKIQEEVGMYLLTLSLLGKSVRANCFSSIIPSYSERVTHNC